jgi:hypothetical protein
MANVTVADQVKAPADVVWALIGPYGSISSWMPGIASADVEGSGVGAVRVLTTDDGGKITERLLAENPSPLGYTYEILSSPFPIQNYVSTIMVVDEGDGSSTMSWVCNFEPVDAPEEELTQAFSDMYKGAIANIQRMTEGDAPEGPDAA